MRSASRTEPRLKPGLRDEVAFRGKRRPGGQRAAQDLPPQFAGEHVGSLRDDDGRQLEVGHARTPVRSLYEAILSGYYWICQWFDQCLGYLQRTEPAKKEEIAMDFSLTEDQLAIRAAVEKICADFGDEYWLRKDREGGFPHDFHAAIAGAGWLGIAMPTEVGGAGLGITEAAILMQTVAESGGGIAAASTIHMNIFGLHPVVVFGTPEQQQRWLPPLIAGEQKACFGVTEPNAGLNTLKLKTRAVREGDHYVVQRAEDLDLHRAGRAQDPAARAHDADRGSRRSRAAG